MRKKYKKALELHSKFQSVCDLLALEAQQKIDFDSDVACTYIDGDGLVFSAEVPGEYPYGSKAYVCPVYTFFKFAEGRGRVTYEEFKSLCI